MTTRKATSPEERFWARVNKTDTCWLWTGPLTWGYGHFSAGGDRIRAHRYAYELLVGPIPAGLTIDHLCRVRHCVNPDHLEPVTDRVNVLRGEGPTAVNARKMYCKNGHELTPDNIYTPPDSRKRQCRACRRRRSSESCHRLREREKMREPSPLQCTVLTALRAAGGRATVYGLIRDGHLPAGQTPDGRAYRDGKRVGYGLAFAALERKGIVESVYGGQIHTSAGASKVWSLRG